MKTMAEQYPTPERWESGNNHEETKRLREEKRQKEGFIRSRKKGRINPVRS
jgi:hypothetical protein